MAELKCLDVIGAENQLTVKQLAELTSRVWQTIDAYLEEVS